MAEDLTPADVEAYTEGAMEASDPETLRALNAALGRVRRWCGWHVSPVQSQTFAMHGTGLRFIVLPTLKVASITSITIDNEALDLAEVEQYTNEPGVLYMKDRCWQRCDRIEVVANHGFTAAEAEDFREAVLQLIDSAGIAKGTGRTDAPNRKKVDDVEYSWSGITDRSWGIAKNPMNESSLYQFRLFPFA